MTEKRPLPFHIIYLPIKDVTSILYSESRTFPNIQEWFYSDTTTIEQFNVKYEINLKN